MNEPQSVITEKIALTILAGESMQGCALASPADFKPVSYAASALWPPAVSVNLLDSFEVPPGLALLWTYISAYTTLADESSTAIAFGFNYPALARVQYRSAASNTSNYLNVTSQVQAQAVLNTPILLLFDTDTVPRLQLFPNGSTQTADSLRVLAKVQGYLIPAALSSIFRQHVSSI